MSPHRPPTRTAQLTHGLAALAALVILLAGLPTALLTVAGSPIPQTPPTWTQITAALTQPDTGNTVFLAVVKTIAWTAWLCFTTATITETIGYLRRRPTRHMPAPIRPLQHLARTLITTVALLAGTTGPFTGTTATHTGHSTATTVQAIEPVAHTEPLTHHPAMADTHHAAAIERRRWRTRVIRHGDTLWAIAHHTLGSGTRYLKIFNASRHLHQPHGLPPLRDPDRIFPGQRITIPSPHGAPSRHPRPRPTRHAMQQKPPHVTSPEPLAPSPPATPKPPEAATPQPTSPARPPATRPPVTTTPNPTARPEHTPSATASPAPSRALPGTPQPESPGSGQPQRREPVTVTLPSSAYLGLGLAGAISIALAATRLHRRRRRHLPEWTNPSPGAVPAPPEPVAKARKAHLDTYTDRGEPVPTDAELVAADLTTPAPTRLTVGVRDGRDLTVALAGLNLALTGPAATAAARAIVTELLAKSHRYRVEVIIPAPDADALFAGTGITPADLADAIPGLIITPSLTAAITRLETEFVHRARLMEATDEPDVPALRTSDPGEPLPAIILIASAPTTSEALHAILRLGRPYCVGGLLLGTWPAGTTLHTAADGSITRADGPNADAWTGGRLFHLTATDTAAILNVVQTAAGAPEPDPPNETEPVSTNTCKDPPVQAEKPEPHAEEARPSSAPGPAPEPRSRPVRLRVLGAVRVDADGEPITTGLRRITREFLAYLALHPDGITREQGIDALMPERDLATGTTMFHTAINNTRKTLRAATGLREPMFITYTQSRYRIDPNLIDVDLWDLNHALDRARKADTGPVHVQALQRVLDLYTGELAEDLTYEWAESERENIRRHTTDALAHLAELTHNDHPDQALTALETALTHDPYAEALYQRLMRLQARLDRPDAVRRTYQHLKTRLADLDTDPSPETDQLLHHLLHPPTPRKSDPPRGPVSGRGPRPRPNRTGTVRALRPRNQA